MSDGIVVWRGEWPVRIAIAQRARLNCNTFQKMVSTIALFRSIRKRSETEIITPGCEPLNMHRRSFFLSLPLSPPFEVEAYTTRSDGLKKISALFSFSAPTRHKHGSQLNRPGELFFFARGNIGRAFCSKPDVTRHATIESGASCFFGLIIIFKNSIDPWHEIRKEKVSM